MKVDMYELLYHLKAMKENKPSDSHFGTGYTMALKHVIGIVELLGKNETPEIAREKQN